MTDRGILSRPPARALRRPALPALAVLAAAGLLGALPGCPRPRPSAAPPAGEPAHGHGGGHGAPSGPLGHRFEDPERWSKRWDDPARDAWQRPAEVVALLALAPGLTVADVGAGTGYFEPHLSRAVGPTGKVLALDVEPSMVEWITARAAREGLGNVEARLVPFDDPALPPGGVHRVLIVNTWHHIPAREAWAAKLAAGLVPGDHRVLIVDYTMESEEGPPKAERLPPDKVISELAAAGFAATLVEEALPRQYAVSARLRSAGSTGSSAP